MSSVNVFNGGSFEHLTQCLLVNEGKKPFLADSNNGNGRQVLFGVLHYSACGCRRVRAQGLMDRDQWHQNVWVNHLLLLSSLPAVVFCNETEPLIFH